MAMCAILYQRQLVAALYAPRGVEMVYRRADAVTRDNNIVIAQGAMSRYRLDMCAI